MVGWQLSSINQTYPWQQGGSTGPGVNKFYLVSFYTLVRASSLGPISLLVNEQVGPDDLKDPSLFSCSVRSSMRQCCMTERCPTENQKTWLEVPPLPFSNSLNFSEPWLFSSIRSIPVLNSMIFMTLLIESENITNIRSQKLPLRFSYYTDCIT